MLQTRICEGLDFKDLQRSVNEALSEINSDDPKIIWETSNLLAIIEYVVNESYKKSLCCECQYWKENETSSLMGICQLAGKRKRYDCKPCASYKDIRE